MNDLEELSEKLKRLRASNDARPKTFVITGASSGIGLYAAKLFAQIDPLNRIILVARTVEKAECARKQVTEILPRNGGYHDNVLALACDHSSLDAVRQFVPMLRQKLRESYCPEKWAQTGIDILCLNAAVLTLKGSAPQFTTDNFELTFQINYLAPFLLATLCIDLLNLDSRIIYSTTALQLSQTLCLDGMIDQVTGKPQRGFAMIDGTDFDHKRSYALSKLCGAILCAELNRRLCDKSILVNCFSPGLMRMTSLFRNQYLPDDDFSRNNHSKFTLLKEKTIEWGAGALVFMALGELSGRAGGQFWHDSETDTPGPLAQYGLDFRPMDLPDANANLEDRRRLWKLTSQLLDLSGDIQ